MVMYNNPWKELERMQREMDSLFTSFGKRKYRFPAVNLYDNDDTVTAEFILPGLRKEDISISFENGSLLVKGERHNEIDTDKYTLVREERNRGSFNRSVDIPVQIEVDAITADFADGILTISLPKAEEAKPKQISIN